jgi:putative tryptophan/tyrosine transport system substrate-binding protein
LVFLVTAYLVASGSAFSQADRNLPKLGILWTADPLTAAPYLNAFKEGLRELGWVDGRTVTLIERYDHDDPSQRAKLAAELVEVGVNLLYANDPSLPSARKASKSIPIVCPDFSDPVSTGAATSLARPADNVTGMSWQSVESAVKRLQLTKELLPRTQRVGFIFEPTYNGSMMELPGLLGAAEKSGVAIEKLEVRSPPDLERALLAIRGKRLDALLVSTTPITWPAIERIIEVANQNRIAVVSVTEHYARSGAVVTYGADLIHLYRRSAYYVDRILKGVPPGDLPIEQPTQFDLIVNLRAASILRLQVPESLTLRAPKIIR